MSGSIRALGLLAATALLAPGVQLVAGARDNCPAHDASYGDLISFDRLNDAYPVARYCYVDGQALSTTRSRCSELGGEERIRRSYQELMSRHEVGLEEAYDCDVAEAMHERTTEAENGNLEDYWWVAETHEGLVGHDELEAWEAATGIAFEDIHVSDAGMFLKFVANVDQVKHLHAVATGDGSMRILGMQAVPHTHLVHAHLDLAVDAANAAANPSATHHVPIEIMPRYEKDADAFLAALGRIQDVLGEFEACDEADSCVIDVMYGDGEDQPMVIDVMLMGVPVGLLDEAPGKSSLPLRLSALPEVKSVDLDEAASVTFPPTDGLEDVELPEVEAEPEQQVATSWEEQDDMDRRRLTNLASYALQSGVEDRTPLYSNGLKGRGITLGCADSGIDVKSCFFKDPNVPVKFDRKDDFRTTRHRKIRRYYAYGDKTDRPENPGEPGHGTHTCGSMLGKNVNGNTDNAGTAYNAKVSFFDFGNSQGWSIRSMKFILTHMYGVGAKIASNSWGQGRANKYTKNTQEADNFLWKNQDFMAFFAAGNYGSRSRTITSPADAKSIISVGYSLSGPWTDYLISYSGRGPTFDDRLAPTVVGAGNNVYAALAGAKCGVGKLSGTSVACPLAAGIGGLVSEYFIDGFYPQGKRFASDRMKPMGSLVKAVIVASGKRMTKLLAHPGDFPANDQGFGNIKTNLALPFPGDSSFSLFVDGEYGNDCNKCPKLSRSGKKKTYGPFYITDSPNVEFRAVLVWSDYQGSRGSSKTLVNDLDIIVRDRRGRTVNVNGKNRRDSRNTAERVIVSGSAARSNGPYTVTVSANRIVRGPQPYSLVVTGAFERTQKLYPRYAPRVTRCRKSGSKITCTGTGLNLGRRESVRVECGGSGNAKPRLTKVAKTSVEIRLDGTCSGGYTVHYTIMRNTVSTTFTTVTRVSGGRRLEDGTEEVAEESEPLDDVFFDENDEGMVDEEEAEDFDDAFTDESNEDVEEQFLEEEDELLVDGLEIWTDGEEADEDVIEEGRWSEEVILQAEDEVLQDASAAEEPVGASEALVPDSAPRLRKALA